MEKSAKELLETISLLQRAIGIIIPWKKETKDSINLEVNTKFLPEQKMAITQQFSNNFIKVMYAKKENSTNMQENKSLKRKRKLYPQIPHPKTNYGWLPNLNSSHKRCACVCVRAWGERWSERERRACTTHAALENLGARWEMGTPTHLIKTWG